ncbi:MAG TPA: mechanosensitive ion channel domain-containing protein [Edaphocola sp.]|nr:mechanosensitive ion channel domain-containing protein [Edaphocola sp.]
MLEPYIIKSDKYIKLHFPKEMQEISILAYKVIGIVLLFFILSFILRKTLLPLIKWSVKKYGGLLNNALLERKVYSSFLNFLPMVYCYLIMEDFFYRSKKYLPVIDMIFNWLIVTVIAQILYRTSKAIELYASKKTNNNNITGFKAVGQSIRIVGSFLYVIITFSIFLKVSPLNILAGLGAITAIVFLIFRDAILGFISGIHIVASRHFKVGDWISIGKYHLEGNVQEINLLTTKIKNFDNTISSIPTYDLINTEVRNAQVLLDNNSRRIKRSIVFNIDSFKFVDFELFQRLNNIKLLNPYFHSLNNQVSRLEKMKEDPQKDYLINGKQLTNIGVFRHYVSEYLSNHEKIDAKKEILVRQMQINANGLPLEIYCFTKSGVWQDFENIQSDLFDHLLVAAKEFDLEITHSALTK